MGTSAQEGRNISGSRRRQQIVTTIPGQAMLNPRHELQPRSANAFGKFILVHVILLHISHAQTEMSQNLGVVRGYRNPNTSSLSADNNNSGYTTPVEGSDQSPQHVFKASLHALKKWRRMWDLIPLFSTHLGHSD